MHVASCRVLALAHGVHLEADIFEHSVNENATTLKRKAGSINRFLRTVGENGSAFVSLHVMILELGQRIFFLLLWNVDGPDGAVLQEHVAYVDRRGLSYVSCILLEGESQNGELLGAILVHEAIHRPQVAVVDAC